MKNEIPTYNPKFEIPERIKAFVSDEDLATQDIYIEENILFRIVSSQVDSNTIWKDLK
jgi:hypothetical protein